jgi:hypothetical protein
MATPICYPRYSLFRYLLNRAYLALHMRNYRRFRSTFYITTLLTAAFILPKISEAHVGLLQPNGSEVLTPGQGLIIKWEVILGHDTQNWDLTYSVEGENGPWLEIATDLPVGDPSDGSLHSYFWTVPDNVSYNVRVRVVQDNDVAFDYEDQSDADLAIVCCNGSRGNANGDPDDKTNISDVTYLADYLFGTPLGPPPPLCP